MSTLCMCMGVRVYMRLVLKRMCICAHTYKHMLAYMYTYRNTHQSCQALLREGGLLIPACAQLFGQLVEASRIEILRTTMILNNSFGYSHAVSSIIGIVQSFSYALGLAVRLRSFWSGLRCCTPRPGRLAQRFQGVH